jgi:hypothetical protein
MNRTLYFETVIIDSENINTRLIYNFFQANDLNEPSITALNEDMALRWLIEHPEFRNFFIHRFLPHCSNVRTFYNLEHPFTSKNKMPGDIDLLIVDPIQPHRAIAFECKRIKVVTLESGIPKVNNAGSLKKGVRQANAYQSLGFHQSYLMIILLDDGRMLGTPNTIFRYNKGESVDSIYDIPANEPLHPDVGIIYVRINQMTGKNINHSISMGFCIDKRAVPLEQTTEMTNKVREQVRL